MRDAFPSRGTLFWSSDFIMPLPREDPPTQLLCIGVLDSPVGHKDNIQVLRGVHVSLDRSVQELKQEIGRANPTFAAGKRSDRMSIRFPGLRVERPYAGTRLKRVEGVKHGTLVICSWEADAPANRGIHSLRSSAASAVRSEQDAKEDEQIAALVADGHILLASLKFETEQAQGRRFACTRSSERYLLLHGSYTIHDLAELVWNVYEADCRAEMRLTLLTSNNDQIGRASAVHRTLVNRVASDFNFYFDAACPTWQRLAPGVTLASAIDKCAVPWGKLAEIL